jgi:uncharacterized membrane protein YfcA
VELYLPIADVTVSPVAVVLLGAAIGMLSGLFGVGGGFLGTPMLNIVFGVPYNVAAGTSLAQILGTSVSAAAKHRGLGNVDAKLGFCMLLGGWVGLESGARIVEALKTAEPVTIAGRTVAGLDLFVPIVFIVLLPTVATVMWWESRRAQKRAPRGGVVETPIAKGLRSIRIPPVMQFAGAGIPGTSLWILVGIGFGAGFMSGFLGVGGGFVLVPTLIYALGVPTRTAIGTGLFNMIFLSTFGTFTHAHKGNVDPVLVTLLLVGSIIGAWIGASITRKVRGARIRYWFSLVVYGAAAAVLAKLIVLLVLPGRG